jgi:hypothetical protein
MILHFGNPTCNVVNDGLEALYANALSQSDRCGYNFMFMGSRSVPSRQDMLDYFGNITDPDTREYIIENAYQFSFPNN